MMLVVTLTYVVFVMRADIAVCGVSGIGLPATAP